MEESKSHSLSTPTKDYHLLNPTGVAPSAGSSITVRKCSPVLLKPFSSSGSRKSSPDITVSKTDLNVDSSKSGSTTSAAESTNSLFEINNTIDGDDHLAGNSPSNKFKLPPCQSIPAVSNQQRVISTTEIIPPHDRVHSALDEEKISEHLEKYLLAHDNKANTFVYSSTLGGTNVYCFAPSIQLKRNYWTLVTMGMSGTSMKVPEDITDGHLYTHAEVYHAWNALFLLHMMIVLISR